MLDCFYSIRLNFAELRSQINSDITHRPLCRSLLRWRNSLIKIHIFPSLNLWARRNIVFHLLFNVIGVFRSRQWYFPWPKSFIQGDFHVRQTTSWGNGTTSFSTITRESIIVFFTIILYHCPLPSSFSEQCRHIPNSIDIPIMSQSSTKVTNPTRSSNRQIINTSIRTLFSSLITHHNLRTYHYS